MIVQQIHEKLKAFANGQMVFKLKCARMAWRQSDSSPCALMQRVPYPIIASYQKQQKKKIIGKRLARKHTSRYWQCN